MTLDAIAVGGNVPGFTTLERPLISAAFDDDTDAWTLATDAGQTQARILLDCAPPLVPWIPNLPGSSDFRGQMFHAAAVDADFDPAAQRIAVIGADSIAGRLIGKLTRSGAVVTVFPLAPRRVVRPIRRVRRYVRRQPDTVTAPIDAITTLGIRTSDGSHHDVDTIIFGTGFSVSAHHPPLTGTRGQTLAQVWYDGVEPYFGVAAHGFPNYFMLGGADPEMSLRYVTECLELMTAHTRIEVRRSSQQVFNERTHLHPPPGRPVSSAFDLSTGGSDDVYDGPATLTLAEDSRQVRVRLSGRVDPIDGQYHWQGTIFGQIPQALLKSSRAVNLTVDGRNANARITEATQQGAHSIAGVGLPPFALADIESLPHA